MKKWEYKWVEGVGNLPNRYLNDLGEEGWELVTVLRGGGATIAYFKREITE